MGCLPARSRDGFGAAPPADVPAAEASRPNRPEGRAGMSHANPRAPLTHRAVLSIAVPVMLSNVSTPLIGVVDTAVVGQLPDPAYVGAVALGSLIFNFLFWSFGFLRMGTTGLTAQALGAQDVDELR